MKKKLLSMTLLLYILFCLPTGANAAQMLIPGGNVVGLELQNDTVSVASFEKDSSAEKAGLAPGDRLLAVNGQTVTCAQDVRKTLNRSHGTVELTVLRGNSVKKLQVEPAITADGPKLGVYLREGITGIGTVTYYDPQRQTFAALGHGVNDGDGQLLKLTSGNAYPAKITAVRKGKTGQPGQLMGTLTSTGKFGNLIKNTHAGVFGSLRQLPKDQPLPVAEKHQIRLGSATILSTVNTEMPQEYSVEIVKIYSASRQNGRNMLLRITDPQLLAATGGIVQGMSGSPIIQNGHLIGAVTHVLVNDPTTGYGIFIENMLDAAA